MAHSYVVCPVHYIFSTKGRRKLIARELQERLWPYIGGIARQNRLRALAVGGTGNHVHVLVSIPATVTIAKAVQLIKGGSSKWISETFPSCRDFEWQAGYGAFAVSVSGLGKARKYIENQQEHHRTRTFEQEYLAFLHRHGVECDPRYVFD
ncbi:MAG TPA: IS200/IS605 family transposase [Phycisphaerae bacterium]|nr:IS200/IS605 family transposase [Phycisphaerae bacterium]HUT56784.1 IS200/IS605 family transposase [Phycisphaerae bacterium]